MRSSQTISLFSERPEPIQNPYTFVASVVAHAVGFTLLLFGLMSAPKIKTHSITDELEVRHLDLHTIEDQMQEAIKRGMDAQHPRTTVPDELQKAQQQALRQIVQAPPGAQTLVQPDILKPITLKEIIPVPTVVLWNNKSVVVKTLVAPVPEKPPVAIIKPSTLRPNQEMRLADIPIPSSQLTLPNQLLLASTTSPVVVQGPKPTPPSALTTAKGSGQPSQGTVLSLSDQKMANGAVTLPPVNESAAVNSPGSFGQGQDKQSGNAGASQGAANGAGQGDANRAGSGLGGHPAGLHISRLKEGKFGAVVVGSSLEDLYPETSQLMSGKMAYTVYLPMGLPKNWILQYSLSASEEASAAGSVAHIDAPWPYEIQRPTLAPGSFEAEALMVHGFVNQAGRFEALKLAFPPDFADAQYVLDLLQQWQFRPAQQNGKNVKVEVLLIIPEIRE